MKHTCTLLLNILLCAVLTPVTRATEQLTITEAGEVKKEQKSSRLPQLTKPKDTFEVIINKGDNKNFGVFYAFCKTKGRDDVICLKNTMKPYFMSSFSSENKFSNGFSKVIKGPFTLKQEDTEYVRLLVATTQDALISRLKNTNIDASTVLVSEPVEQRNNQKGTGSVTFTITATAPHLDKMSISVPVDNRTWEPLVSTATKIKKSLKDSAQKAKDSVQGAWRATKKRFGKKGFEPAQGAETTYGSAASAWEENP